ncbi:50S ribosomal protein L24 [Flagellatimonas centrodinii]|uniref:50S ribosomal protein L24 n=1 Tax=Flagellatimonas centrodinii TaxID=2806210 RepID=UPI001FEF99DF|nr:50S ribosomal protein L24 [Flagellatimonas centrodinii]ULQ47329.1 50S ribosomal protein L24 [Flagellatimonas centrodinii]
MNKIKKGDEVVVIAGKDKGRRGQVEQVFANGKLLVDGINVAKKHQRPNPQAGVAGGVVEKTLPIDRSNVMVWNPKAEKGDRVSIVTEGEGADQRKVRVFKSTKTPVDA